MKLFKKLKERREEKRRLERKAEALTRVLVDLDTYIDSKVNTYQLDELYILNKLWDEVADSLIDVDEKLSHY